MRILEERHKRIIKKVNLTKLPFKISETKFRDFASETTKIFIEIFKERESNESLRWCFSTVKKGSIWISFGHALNKIRQEDIVEIEENIQLAGLKKIEPQEGNVQDYIDTVLEQKLSEGIEKGFYVELKPRVQNIKDAKIKNLRPSEEVASAFINWYIKIINSFDGLIKKNK